MVKTDYKVGDSYTFTPREIGKDSRGNEYLVLLDKQGEHEYRVYPQLVKFQEDNLPQEVTASVRSIDILGRIQFRLDEGAMIREHYNEGKPYLFHITDTRDDPKTGAHYYLIEDNFSMHRFYHDDCEEYKKGEDCILIIKGFNEKGFIKFEAPQSKKEATPITEQPNQTQPEQPNPNNWDNAPILDIGDEDTHLEFKTSIVFVPGQKNVADIDSQLDNILKELCAFMNTDGGELYIGIHDKTKRIVGISKDYPHLNDGDDRYAGDYEQSHDGYKLKIRNTIDRKCTSLANSLIDFEFKVVEGAEYCKITVKKAQRPVWLNGTQLWIRQGCRLKQLKGDDISFFITDTMNVTIQNQLETEGVNASTVSLTKEELEEMLHKIVNVRKQIDIPLPPPPSLDEVKEWVNWLDDGSWKRTREKATDKQYCIQVPVPEKITDPMILFCYESGAVNCMKYTDFRRGTNMKVLEVRKTWNLEAGRPVNILIAPPSSLLVGYSVDYNGLQYVKFHDITDFTPTAAAKNKGVPFVPSGFRMLSFKVVDGSYRKKLAPLQRTKQQRSQDAGEPLDSPVFDNQITLLNSL